MFIIDDVDRDRWPECKTELDGLLDCDELDDVPIRVLGNKIDLNYAASEDGLRGALRFFEHTYSGKGIVPGVR